jgi:hypothetical protein
VPHPPPRTSATRAARVLATAVLATSAAACGAGDAPPVRDADRAAAGAGTAPVSATVAPPPAASPMPSPAPPGSAEPNLVAGPDGIYLSWLERRGDDRHALRFARWDGRAWSEPGQVMERGGLFVNWADFPSMAVLDDGTLAAHWLERSGPRSYDYDVRVALSRDGGAAWGADIIPHRGGVAAEHGFVAMLPLDGGLGLVWLDGRETVHGRPMSLRFTTLAGPAAGLGEEVLLDATVCDCCQTAAARTSDGLVVAYRGRTDGEVRDIRVVRRVDGRWTGPRSVHDDGWVINACPVNGPAMAADGDRVVVAWFTGAPPGDRVLAAVSDDGGASFGPPVRVDDGQGMGRVAVAMLDDGEALITWLERTPDGAEIRTRRLRDGAVGPSAPLAATAAARASGFPRVARRGDELLFAWTTPGGAPGDLPRVSTAVAPVADAAPAVAREGRP